MSAGAIDRDAARLNRAIARLDDGLRPAAVRAAYTQDEMSALRVRRRDGRVVRLLYLESLVDEARLQTDVLDRLSSSVGPVRRTLPLAQPVKGRAAADDVLGRGGVLVFEGRRAYAIPASGVSGRDVSAPSTERAIIGPKDAMVESLQQNLALIRSHLRDARLHARQMTMGTRARTDVAVLYLDEVADATQVDLVLARLTAYQPERLGFVTQLLKPLFGAIWTVLLPVEMTERPYRVADYLFRGRVAVLADGSPLALVTPVYFIEYFIDEEEYLQATLIRWFVRALRAIAFFIALMIPGLYVAVLTVNTTIMPGLLAIAVASTRQTLPYPISVETFLLLVVLDIMAEATVSMKGVLGPAISIVGSLIIGDAAVRANLASNLGVILIALTALSTFITPRYPLTYVVRVLKYPVLFVSAAFGIIGWTVAGIWLLAYLTSSRALGSHFLLPLAPAVPKAMTTATGPGARRRGGLHAMDPESGL